MGQWVKGDETEAFVLHEKLERIYSQIKPRLPQVGERIHPHYTLNAFIDAFDTNDSLVLKLFEFLLRDSIVKANKLERKREREEEEEENNDNNNISFIDWKRVPTMSMHAGSVLIPLRERPSGLLRSRVRDRENRDSTISFIATMLSGILREEDLQNLHFFHPQTTNNNNTFNYDTHSSDNNEGEEDEEEGADEEEVLIDD